MIYNPEGRLFHSFLSKEPARLRAEVEQRLLEHTRSTWAKLQVEAIDWWAVARRRAEEEAGSSNSSSGSSSSSSGSSSSS